MQSNPAFSRPYPTSGWTQDHDPGPADLMAFEVLDGAFMRLGLLQTGERTQVAALSGFRIFLARIKAVLS